MLEVRALHWAQGALALAVVESHECTAQELALQLRVARGQLTHSRGAQCVGHGSHYEMLHDLVCLVSVATKCVVHNGCGPRDFVHGVTSLGYICLRGPDCMSVTLSTVYNMTNEMFFKEYVCEKIMFALTSPWPLDGGLTQNYSQVGERRYKAVLYEEEPSEENDFYSVLVMDITRLWIPKHFEPESADDCKLKFKFKNGSSRPEGMVMLDFIIGGYDFSMCFDFREEKHSKGKYFYAPAYVQASNLAFMIAVVVEVICYAVPDFGRYDASLDFSENMNISIEDAIRTWDHPRPPDKLKLFKDTEELYSICCERTGSGGKTERHEMMSIAESGDPEERNVNIKFKRGGGVDISFTRENRDGVMNAWKLFHVYYAVLEVYHRARGVDTFCVLEKLRNPTSVNCADFVSNAIVTSGFKCFAYVKKPEMAKLESVEEVLPGTPDEETVDRPSMDESMLDYIVEKLAEENLIPENSDDLSLLMGSVGSSTDPFSVGGDLSPGQLNEIEQQEFDAVLVSGDDEDDLVQKMEDMKTGVTEDDRVVGKKNKKHTLFAVYFQPETYNAKIKSTFTPRKPLDNDLYRRLNDYSLAIKGKRSDVRYVDNEVDKLFALAHRMSHVKDDGSEANVQSFKELQGEFDAAEEALKAYIARQNSAYKSAKQPMSTRRSPSHLGAILIGRPIVSVPDEVRTKAGASFTDKEEWQRLYSEVMMFEDYMVLKMMKLKKEYLVSVLSRRENKRGLPIQMPSTFDWRSAVRIAILDLAECTFACTLIQYTPTFYVKNGSFYFPREELRVFTTMIETWLADNGANAVQRMAESLHGVAPMSQKDREVMLKYGNRLYAFKRTLAGASG